MITDSTELYYPLADKFNLWESEIDAIFEKPFIMAETLDEEILIEKIQDIIRIEGSYGVKKILNWIC